MAIATMRRRNINKAVNPMLDDWMRENTQGIFKPQAGGFESMDILARAQMSKKIIQVLWNRGLEPFKRGTKEPERIREALKEITRQEVLDTEEATTVKTIFD